MAVERDRWIGAPVDPHGRRRPLAGAYQAIVRALEAVRWGELRRRAPVRSSSRAFFETHVDAHLKRKLDKSTVNELDTIRTKWKSSPREISKDDVVHIMNIVKGAYTETGWISRTKTTQLPKELTNAYVKLGKANR